MDKPENALGCILSSPTLMAFQMSKQLTPLLENRGSKNKIGAVKRKRSEPPVSKSPVKLAGLFAAMDLSLSAGAISATIPTVLNKTDKKQSKKKRQRSISLDCSQFAGPMSAISPALLGTSALFPAFVNSTSQKTQGNKEPEMENVQEESANDLQSLSGDTDMIDGPRNEGQSSVKDFEGPKKPTRRNTYSSEKEVVAMSAMTLVGEKVVLDYKHRHASIGGKTKKVFKTNAPRPTLKHYDSVSESKSVSAATGLYRTIVGEVPKFLTINDSETDDSVPPLSPPNGKPCQNESRDSRESNSTSSDDVFVTHEPSELANNIKITSPELFDNNNNDNDRDRESDASSSNLKDNLTVHQTLSKSRRERLLQIDQCYDALAPNGHSPVRKTKSDNACVTVMNTKRSQIPIRPTKSFDARVNEASTKKVYVSTATIALKKVDTHTDDSKSSNLCAENELAKNSRDDVVYKNDSDDLNIHDRATYEAPILNQPRTDASSSSRTDVEDSDAEVTGQSNWHATLIPSGLDLDSSPELDKRSTGDSSPKITILRRDRCKSEKSRIGDAGSQMRRRRFSQMSKTKEVSKYILSYQGYLIQYLDRLLPLIMTSL